MSKLNPPRFCYYSSPILKPQPGVPWADTMVLNPSIMDDPESERLHMLFRASGPWPTAAVAGGPLPYPIFLGYASSDDGGMSWNADFVMPCLAPRLALNRSDLNVLDRNGRFVTNHANGCIEDPRWFRLEGKDYVTVACRMFPPGPYWEHHDPMQCAPSWAAGNAHTLGRAARENLTVSVLFEVNPKALEQRDYENAFVYVAPLTDPERGDNRDVVLFPCKFTIEGREQYLCLHRPQESVSYAMGELPPSILLAAADRLEDLSTQRATHRLLAAPEFPWEGDRIGASWTPISLGDGEWLLPYHGKQDEKVGYTQSFMILATGNDGWPEVRHRCSVRLMYAQQPWELEGRFKTPCLFTCGGIVRDGELVMTYGAADTVSGLARVDMGELVAYLRCFDEHGLVREEAEATS